MATSQSRRYTIYIDNTEAQRNLDLLKERARRLTEEVSRIQATGGNATRQLQQLANTREQVTLLESSIRSGLTRSLRDLQGEVTRTERLLRRATDPATVSALNAQLVVARQNLLEYRAGVLGISSAQAQLAAQSAGIFTRLKDGIKASLFGNLMAQGIQMAIGMAVNFVREVKNIALEAEGVREKFLKLNDPGLLRNLRAATRGTVSDLELMKKAVQASNFQIPLETVGTLLNFARIRARESGEDLDYLTNSVIAGIARKSTQILDNLGITADRVKDEFKKTGDFAKAVTNIIQEEMDKSGKYVEKYADSVARLGAWWENVKLKTAEAITDSADDFAYAAAKINGDQEKMMEIGQRRVESFARSQHYGKQFQELELQHLKIFKEKYAGLTEEQQRDVLAITKLGLAETEKAQKAALKSGNWELATNLTARLSIWNNYFSSLNKKQDADKITLAGMEEELDILIRNSKELDIRSKNYSDTLKAIKKLQQDIADATGKTAEQAAEKARQLAEQTKRKQEQLDKQLAELRVKVLGDTLTGYEKEILASQHKYEVLKKQLVKYGVDTKELEDLHHKDILQIHQRHFRELEKEFAKGRDLTKTARKQLQEKVVSGTGAAVVRSADYLLGQAQKSNADQVSARSYEVSKATLGMRLKAQLALLDAEKRQELTSTELTQNQRAEIEEKYRKARQEAEVSYYSKLVGIASGFVSQVLSVYQVLSEASAQRENNELARDKAVNDKKKEQYQRQLDTKQISRQEYDRKIEAMDKAAAAKEQAFKKAQFERDKNAKIIQGSMQIAQSALQAYSSAPPPYSFILAAAVMAAGAIQLLTIKNSKAPEYGEGGLLRGPKHNSVHKGMPVVHPQTGQVQAYLEGDEAILKRAAMSDNKRYTATGTISQIASAFNSLHGGVQWDSGAFVKPAWMDYRPKPVSLAAVSSTISNLRTYAAGGVFGSEAGQRRRSGDNLVVSMDPQLYILLSQNSQMLSRLDERLSRGITAIASVNQITQEQQRLQAIRSVSTFRP